MKTPKLVPLDMSKAKGHELPGINEEDTYLVLWDGDFHAGTFSRQWYGWNFNGVYDAGLQFDAPGTNRSHWEMVWRIVKR